MNKKILVLSNMYPGEHAKTFGIFVENQVKALRGQGLDVDVIAVTNPNMGKVNVLKKYMGWMGKTIVNVLTKGKSYDVVHAHYVFPTGMLALLYKVIWNKRLIVTAHGGDIDRMAKKSPRIRKWTKYILQKADHVIAVGHELHDTIRQEFNVEASKISIINMGVNREVFKPAGRTEARQRLGIPMNENMLLFVGNLIRQKGLMELLSAYEKIKQEHTNSSLYLIGSAKDKNFRHQLNTFMDQHNLKDVHILEAMPQREIAEWMSASNVFVLPSHIEGFGLVALEAMSCHTPVVGTKVGGLRYLLAEGAGLLAEPGNEISLYESIKEVLENPQLAEKLVEKGEGRAQENDQRYLIQKVLDVYFPS